MWMLKCENVPEGDLLCKIFLKPASVELYPSFCAAALSYRNLSHSGPSFRSRPTCMALLHSSSKDLCFAPKAPEAVVGRGIAHRV